MRTLSFTLPYTSECTNVESLPRTANVVWVSEPARCTHEYVCDVRVWMSETRKPEKERKRKHAANKRMFMCNARRAYLYLCCVLCCRGPTSGKNCEEGYTNCSLFVILPFNVRCLYNIYGICVSFEFRSYFCAHIKRVGRFGIRWLETRTCIALRL